uniref:allophycocyanin beta 18 subunit n=1 Tax=Erythrolobus coxiae TaxID=362235 RepID=UPI001FCD3B07|nr:allophycocyanin beta 18 subunit [Erythrolobus coxiae]UNJ17636.1 allophycocyanin beta 18 subunit [Erythrolobus coxiae]
MQDAITNVLNQYDTRGRYIDSIGTKKLNEYFKSGMIRINIANFINKETANIIKEASERLFLEQPELLRPCGNALIGNAYTTRRYAACLRDIEYYLRYSSYAIVAGDTKILDERVLDGLKDTYNSLLVPIGPTIRVIDILSIIIKEKFTTNEEEEIIASQPFNYLIDNLSDKSV